MISRGFSFRGKSLSRPFDSFDKQPFFFFVFIIFFHVSIQSKKRLSLGGSREGGTPDPIPNSEVKLTSADGTWTLGPGRVGRRQDRVFFKIKILPLKKRGGFLV